MFDRSSKPKKPRRKDAGDRAKSKGAGEYEARHQDRLAERRELEGDLEGARIAREAAAALRAR
jgi:hypothetical protein